MLRLSIRLMALLAAVTMVVVLLGPLTALAAEGAEAGKTAEAVPAHWAFSKFMWASVALVFSVLGTSMAQSKIGVAGAGAMAEKPELAGTIIILIAIPETMVILGFVISAMLIFA